MKRINTVIITFGSNINPKENIAHMLELLRDQVKIIKVSGLVSTSPIGIKEQPDFINGAVKIETTHNNKELKNLLRKLEERLNRDRTLPKFGPRTIDLDITVWNGTIVDNDYYTRGFVKNSVDEIA